MDQNFARWIIGGQMSSAVEASPSSDRVQPLTGEVRYHSLDALRAFALLLGVVFHAAESFSPGVARYWAIEDNSTSGFLALFRHACHSFRMETFFLIAGFFARLLLHRRGIGGFVRNRISRILVPLVVGWLVLYPVLVWIWIWGASVTGRLVQFGVPPELAETPTLLLAVGFFARLQFIPKFDLTHLWFLHQLLVVYALFLLGRELEQRVLDRRGRLPVILDRAWASLCSSGWSLVVLAAVTVPMLMLMNSWGVDTPQKSLLPHPPTTLLYGLCFTVGWLLHRQPHLLEIFAGRWRSRLLLGALLVLPTGAGLDWLHELGWLAQPVPGLRWAYSALYALMMWSFVLGFLGLFVRFRRQPSARWRYIADSSYWIYLVHLPLVVSLQVLVGTWPGHWTWKYPLILAVAVPLLFLSYHHLARPTFIGAQLNGRKYPRSRKTN